MACVTARTCVRLGLPPRRARVEGQARQHLHAGNRRRERLALRQSAGSEVALARLVELSQHAERNGWPHLEAHTVIGRQRDAVTLAARRQPIADAHPFEAHARCRRLHRQGRNGGFVVRARAGRPGRCVEPFKIKKLRVQVHVGRHIEAGPALSDRGGRRSHSADSPSGHMQRQSMPMLAASQHSIPPRRMDTCELDLQDKFCRNGVLLPSNVDSMWKRRRAGLRAEPNLARPTSSAAATDPLA